MKPVKHLMATLMAVLLVVIPAASVLAEPGQYIPVLAVAVEESLNSQTAVLMDAGTGEILIEKGADEKRQIASVTKLMTMLLVMEAIEDGRVKLTDEVVATPHACSYGGSQIYLEPGERFTVQEMLMAVTIKSANDAAIALSEHVAGSEAAFVALMNKRSEELGMQNTHFINACGLDDVSVSGNSGEKGYSSARDVAIMSRAVLKYHPMLKEWFKTRITYLQRAKGPVELFNTNYRFIGNFQGADGLKTGLTDDAGWCLSATAERNGFRLIAVALGAPTDELRYQDVAAMLNYGFANFTGQTVVKAGEVMGEVVVNRGQQPTLNVVAKNNLAVLLKKGESLDDLEKLIELPPKVFAPVGAGQALGEMQLVKDGKVLGRIELIAATDVQRLGFFGNLGRLLQGLFR